MASYIIIGGDGKEYGPVSDADVRLWISEGRLNGGSRVKAESDAEFRPLAQFPEFATALSQQPAAPAPAAPVVHEESLEDILQRDYELDLGGCISSGWKLLNSHFGLIFGVFVLMVVLQIATGSLLGVFMLPFAKALLHTPAAVQVGVNYLSSALTALVVGPLMGGLFLVYLKSIRGEAVSFGGLFDGFQRAFGQLFLGALIITLINGACLLPFQYVWHVKTAPLMERMQQMQQMQGDPTELQNIFQQFIPAATACLPVLLICLVPLTFFLVSFQYTLPLILDKEITFSAALKTSWKMVMKHWWQVFGLTILAGLVSAAGLLGCCVGVLFTAPIGLAAQMYAYETIFGARKE